MNLTEEQLASAKSHLEKGKTPLSWMQENGIEVGPDARPNRVIMLLRQKYGKQELQPLMAKVRESAALDRVSMLVGRILERTETVERCDEIVAKLQDAIVVVEAKKSQIQAG